MPVQFSAEDLGRVFDARAITRGRTFVLTEAAEIALAGDTVSGTVRDAGRVHPVSLTPSLMGKRVIFVSSCGCGKTAACAHLAATALLALERFPSLRKAHQQSFLDAMLSGAPAAQNDTKKLVFHLSPGQPPFACYVTATLESDNGRVEAMNPRRILADRESTDSSRALARLLGGGENARTGVNNASVAAVVGMMIETGNAKWAATGKRLIRGNERMVISVTATGLPEHSALIHGVGGYWYVDAATGEAGRVKFRPAVPVGSPARRTPLPSRPAPPLRRTATNPATERVIVERSMTPVLRMRPIEATDDFGRRQRMDAMTIEFDYDGVPTHTDDERQFLKSNDTHDPSFIRRDLKKEAAAMVALGQDGFVQMRVPDGSNAKGRRVFVFRGRDAAEAWQRFVTLRVPELESEGWRSEIEGDFGPKFVESIGDFDVRVADNGDGEISLDFGIEIDGTRQDLLPILSHILRNGGVDESRIVDGQLVTSLEDGRILKLPADRVRQLLATVEDLMELARRRDENALILSVAEAPAILDLEDLLSTRWENAAAIQSYLARFRNIEKIPSVEVPAGFNAELRPYQQRGLDWLQHLREHGLAGILADDMGLGKTAQTIAHIMVEKKAGRLIHPVLIVVPTSLVPNWTAELTKFAPSLTVAVLHGLERHELRNKLDGTDVVITTYTVLSRDIELMKDMPWHIAVLDEAQAIKSPDAKATRAVCQLNTGHRLCLSGTPIENNLGELWSEFAFLMPGLLGDRKSFTKRFRSPIEKKNDPIRRAQLVRRIKPFILRRTKAEVATELPPKHVVLRRVELAPEQRDLYESIRTMLHAEVREQIAAKTMGQSRIIVLDALLKLRQVCCDPRLAKLPSARKVEASSKLDDLMEMVNEMIPEGRRILLFSQFTSMLDLIKPRLAEAGIPFVELRGDTRDRAEPVRAFEAGEVPLFLISLKAGGRGLNLVSADTVIHYDPWWNPAVEDQASDRAHRIGQTKSVFVYKLLAAGTVEEKMVELQEKKAALAGIAFGNGDDIAGLDYDDIDYLFGPDTERQAA